MHVCIQTASALTLGYEMPIRIEEGGFPYTIVKAEAQVSDRVKLVSQVEHMVLGGQGKATLGMTMDHWNPQDAYKFGIGLQLQA